MVWCCAPFDGISPDYFVNGRKQQSEGAYPGQRRRFDRTDGNALVSAVPVSSGHEGEDLVSGK